jgi:hypothetical protein
MSAEGTRRADRPPERVHYRQRGVEVTSRYLTVHRDRYQIDELAEIMLARGGWHPGVKIGIATAVVEAAALAPLMGIVSAAVMWLVAPVALSVPLVVALVCAVRWPPTYALVARYRGREVTLFATRDSHEFGSVTRALRRAVGA